MHQAFTKACWLFGAGWLEFQVVWAWPEWLGFFLSLSPSLSLSLSSSLCHVIPTGKLNKTSIMSPALLVVYQGIEMSTKGYICDCLTFPEILNTHWPLHVLSYYLQSKENNLCSILVPWKARQHQEPQRVLFFPSWLQTWN